MIAYVGPDLPLDVLTATSRCAGPLSWNVDRDMPAADRWLESKFPLWARSIFQDWIDNELDRFDAILFSRADDAAQRLYYYLCELRRQGVTQGPEPLIFDRTAIGRASSYNHLKNNIIRLCDQLGVDAERLQRSIAETTLSDDGQSPPGGHGSLCLISGTPPPDGRLHRMVEAVGWRAQGQTLAQTWSDAGRPVAANRDDPFAAVAEQLHGQGHGSRAFHDRAASLMEDVQQTQAQAVLLWFAEEDEARLWHLPAQRDALAAAGIPSLILTRRDWRANSGEAEEIASFLQGLTA